MGGAPKPPAPTFRDCGEKHFDGYRTGLDSVHARNWIASLENHAFPILGDRPVDRITEQDIIGLLTPIWVDKHKVAKDVRHRIKLVFDWARSHGYLNGNPAGEQISAALPKPRKHKRHFEALPYDRVAEALTKLEASRTSDACKLAVKWTVLTCCRSQETRLATWDEIQEEKALWVVPSHRMKAGTEHRVPLSAAAMAILKQAKVTHKGGLLFPSPTTGKALSHASMLKALRTCGALTTETLHGFRSSFRTWASERTSADHAVMELSLAHAVGGMVERAYSRSDLLSKRRALMAAWSAFVAS